MSFRPQQGLTIMNPKGVYEALKGKGAHSFRPQQGLTIMNKKNGFVYGVSEKCFRPQQGLTIMNNVIVYAYDKKGKFPSPTGVNYYE